MKKMLIILVLICTLFLFYACGEIDDDRTDAISFDFLSEVDLETGETVNVYEISDLKNVYYKYRYLGKSESDTWTINYIYTYTYIIDKENISTDFYSSLQDVITESITNFGNTLDLELKCLKDGESEEREIVIEDISSEAEILLIDLYIPYKIIYNEFNSQKDFIVMIPVYTFLALKNDNELIFNNNTYKYDEFISQSNVLNN